MVEINPAENEQSPKDSLLVNLQISKQLMKDSRFISQAFRLANCGQSYNAFFCGCKVIKIIKRCNYRICPICGKIRANKFFHQFIRFLKGKRIARSIYDNGLRFVTFTKKNLDSLEEAIDEIFSSLTNLRRRMYWKDRVKGALGILEIKKGQDGKWNVHAHFILDSSYLDMKSHKKTGEDSKLVQEWKIATGGSGVLDVRRVRDHGGALGYILKYLTKGISDLSSEEIAIFFGIVRGRRLLFTLGNFYKIPKIKKEKFRCPDCGCVYQYLSLNSAEYNLLYGLPPYERKPKPPDLWDYEKPSNTFY